MRAAETQLSGGVKHLVATLLVACMVAILAILPGATQPTAAATPGTPPAGNVLFDEDFSTYAGRWRVGEGPKGYVRLQGGVLDMNVVSPGYAAWSLPDFHNPLRAHQISVMATPLAGSPDGRFGILFGYEDNESFLAAVISLDGTWAVLGYDDGAWVDYTPPDAEPIAAVRSGARVALLVQVADEHVTFRVDQHELMSGALPGLSRETRFGVIAVAGRGYLDVSFDDFQVTEWVEVSR